MRGDQVAAYSDARFSRLAMRSDADTVMYTPAPVMARPATCFTATNAVSGRTVSRTMVVTAVTRFTPAHRTVRSRNRRVTPGQDVSSGVSGQNSWARVAINGRPDRKSGVE